LKTGFAKMAWKTRIKIPKQQNYSQVLFSKCLFWITEKNMFHNKKKNQTGKTERGEDYASCK